MSRPKSRQYNSIILDEGIFSGPIKDLDFVETGTASKPDELGATYYVHELAPEVVGLKSAGRWGFHEGDVHSSIDEAVKSLGDGAIRPAHFRIRMDQKRNCCRVLPPVTAPKGVALN